MDRPIILATLLIIIINLSWWAEAASPTTFCKCTCFSNSTIISLDGDPTSPDGSADDGSSQKIHRTCNDCNRQFCLDYNLPICKGAKDEDVFTTCFQRDSTKDQLVVYTFIFATVGLLVWAAIRPWVQQLIDRVRERNSYMPVSANGDQ